MPLRGIKRPAPYEDNNIIQIIDNTIYKYYTGANELRNRYFLIFGGKMKLPVVRGSNLLRQNMQLPEDLSGNLNLLFVPFYQWQQMEVNSWVPLVSELEQTHPDFHFYELPTIQRRNIFSQTFINEGMRMGIPDPATRERTITLYIDKKAFMSALDMPDEEHTYLLLTDREGNILWRARGENTEEKASSLLLAIQELSVQTNAA